MKGMRAAVFGGGITGLAAARELLRLGHEVDLYEASDHLGGLASTFRSGDGFIYDNGPRFIFSSLAEKIGIAEQCDRVQYYEDLFVGGRYYRFPFGFVRNARYALSAGIATLTRSFHRKPTNLREFLTTYYGRSFSREVLIPLIEKWAGLPASEVSLDFAHRLLPTNVAYIAYSLLKKIRGGVTEDYYKKGRYIVYPRGTNEVIFRTLASTPGLRIHLNTPITKITTSSKVVSEVGTTNGSVSADYYVSTIPITTLAKLLDEVPEIQEWKQLHYRGILVLFLKIARPKILEHLWTWFPEGKHLFYRISEFKNALPSMAPSDKTLISIEIACNEVDPVWKLGAEEVGARVMPDLEALYGIRREEILGFDLKRSPYAYPVLSKKTEEIRSRLRHQTPLANLFVAGRIGMFQYRMMEGCYDSGVTCARAIQAAIEGRSFSGEEARTDRFGRPQIRPE
ncbi:MAG: FAD-dependent oxidoreductase [Pseudomonadota bacterium]